MVDKTSRNNAGKEGNWEKSTQISRMTAIYCPCSAPQNLVEALDSGVWTIHRPPRRPPAGDSICRQWPPPQPPKSFRPSPPPLSNPRFAADTQHGGSQPRRSTPNAALPRSRPLLASAEPAGLRLPSPSSVPARPLRTTRRPQRKVLCAPNQIGVCGVNLICTLVIVSSLVCF
jgi:hypothetical protein